MTWRASCRCYHIAGEATFIPPGVHPTAALGKDVTLGKGVSVGAHAVVEDGASIGDGTILYPLSYVGHGAKIGPR